jgi:endonuclease/exonuclease/phosphatase family metal-dependent hydrolase
MISRWSRRWRALRRWFSHRPLTRIDHLFASDEVIATRAEVIASDVAKIASDHLPLVVEIEI